jgi:hypothetical protein
LPISCSRVKIASRNYPGSAGLSRFRLVVDL